MVRSDHDSYREDHRVMGQFVSCDMDSRGVATVTLQRPPANALNLVLMEELRSIAEDLASRSEVRVVVLRSAVSGYFMAGADLRMLDADWGGIVKVIRRFHEAGNAWERIPVPTIALIDGLALGAGCELALVCDFRIATDRSEIGCPEVKIGLIASGGGTQRLTRLVGKGPALEMLLTGRAVGAEKAEKIGLVTRMVTPDEADRVVDDLASELARLPTLALQETKRCVREGGDLALPSGLILEERANTFLATTADAREGARAFLEKRLPVFSVAVADHPVKEDIATSSATGVDDPSLIIHALAIRGVGHLPALAASTGLSEAEVMAGLAELTGSGAVKERTGRVGGFTLTEAGRARHVDLLVVFTGAPSCAGALDRAYEGFIPLNIEFKSLCTRWQLREAGGITVPNDHADETYDAETITAVEALHASIVHLLAPLSGQVEHFVLYAQRLAGALNRLRDGDISALVTPMVDSYHDVWMELHQDLLLSGRRERGEHDGY